MDILGIGPLELVFILIIILIVMGPRDIVKSSRTVGKFLRQVMTHPTFRLVQDTSREIRNLPYRLAREAGVEDLQKDLEQYSDLPNISPYPGPEVSGDDLGTWGNPNQPAADRTDLPDDQESGEGSATTESQPQTPQKPAESSKTREEPEDQTEE